MSADLLREAAASIRKDAENSATGWVGPLTWGTGQGVADARTYMHYSTFGKPAVALAVADWLDHVAARTESKVQRGGDYTATWSHERDAVEVARAYLGRDA